jgi:hypothetical protein
MGLTLRRSVLSDRYKLTLLGLEYYTTRTMSFSAGLFPDADPLRHSWQIPLPNLQLYNDSELGLGMRKGENNFFHSIMLLP